MKKIKRIILIGIGSIILLILIWKGYQAIALKEEQITLGKELGVNAEEYSNLFPIDYFHSKLTPNMSIDEVHKLIVGYKKVFRCSEIDEFYLYFSDVPEDAIRFAVLYDERNDMKFEHIEYGDQNSGYPPIDTCKEGLLPDKN